jgi:hypothetical protein
MISPECVSMIIVRSHIVDFIISHIIDKIYSQLVRNCRATSNLYYDDILIERNKSMHMEVDGSCIRGESNYGINKSRFVETRIF